VLANLEVIAPEVQRLQAADPIGPNTAARNKRIWEMHRQRSNLARRITTGDDNEMTAPFLVEIKSLGEQHEQLPQACDEIIAERKSWQQAQARLDDLQ
jgi:hypothetical protein